MTVAGIDVLDVTTNPVLAAIFIVVIAAISFVLLHLVVMVTVKPVPETAGKLRAGSRFCRVLTPALAVPEDEPVVLAQVKKVVKRSRSISKRSADVLSSIKAEVKSELGVDSKATTPTKAALESEDSEESEEEAPKTTPRRRASSKSKASRATSKSKAAKSPAKSKTAKSPAKSKAAKSPSRARSTSKKSPGK